MTKPMITIHNSETDEIITREMNDQEFAKYQENETAHAAAEAELAAKAEAKAALLTKLGITEEEAKLLLS